MINKYDIDELKIRAFESISDVLNSYGPMIEPPEPEDVMNAFNDIFYMQGIVTFTQHTIADVLAEEKRKEDERQAKGNSEKENENE